MAWNAVKHCKDWDELLGRFRFNRIKRYPSQIIQVSANVITLAVFVLTALKANAPEFWYILILLAYLLFLMIALFVQSYRHARKARYAEAVKVFHPISHIFRDAFYHLDQLKQSEYEHTLERVLDALSSAFQIVTGTKVRVCIKRLVVEGDIKTLQGVDETRRHEYIYADLYVKDGDSVWPTKRSDVPYPDDKNRLSRNSAFCSILNGDIDYYIQGNIPRAYKRHKYESSSFARYGQDEPGKPKWVLPYRSTIIWPIRKQIDNDLDTVHREALVDTHDLFGFLCVDSESRNVWDARYDREIGAAVADMLFAFIDTWFTKHGAHPADPEQSLPSAVREKID